MPNKNFKVPNPDFLHLEGCTEKQITSLLFQIKDFPIGLPLLPSTYLCAPRKYQIYVDIPFGFCIVRLYSPVYKKSGYTAVWFKRLIKIYDEVSELPF